MTSSIITSVNVETVTITTSTINNAVVYISSKENHDNGSSQFILDYPFYVDKYNIPSGELKTSKTYSPGNYVAILYGSDDSSAFHILDYSTFVLSGSGCQPPNGLHRICVDDKTISVWNVSTCSYDQALCSTGACKDGNCIPPSGLPPDNNMIWLIAVALVGIYLLMKGK